jgi:plastocyanin
MRKLGLAMLFGALVLAWAMPARAAVGVAIPGSEAAGFGTPVVVVPSGQSVTFVNADALSFGHNLSSVARFPGAAPSYATWCRGVQQGFCSVFWTPNLDAGQTSPVLGVDRLAAGQYAFRCTLHVRMTGTLVVV